MDDRDASLLAWLSTVWPEHGPWAAGGVRLPAGGPSAMATGNGVVAMGYGAGRLRAERERMQASSHFWCPELLRAGESALLIHAFGARLEAPEKRLPVPSTPLSLTERRRALLKRIDPSVNAAKSLVALGLKRRHIDRYLEAEVTVKTRVGPSLGGVPGGFLREGRAGPVSLRWDRAQEDGWFALDLAALALDGTCSLEALRGRHREAVAGPDRDDAARDAADEALALAWLVAALREARRGDAELAEEVRQHFRPDTKASGPVRVWVEGPSFVQDDLWEAPGAEVDASRARWLMAELDGLAVGGGVLTVRSVPPVKKGRRAPYREPRSERRRRLFSRWHEGIEVDDEGLVGATPEALALRIADGASGVVIDGTCGVGALAIAHARQPGVARVVAVDLSRERLDMARRNAAIYGVAERIEFVHADVLDVLATRRADRLVLDPPWGGRDYDRDHLTLADLGLDVDEALRRFDGPVRLKLPRSLDVATLPGEGWNNTLLVDKRGRVKMLLASRA